METSVLRGFSNSFSPNIKKDVKELQYIEGQELERTWKAARRQRLKQQEEKIWEEFVKEKDVIGSVCNEDKYQFLEQLPESCIKELLDTELQSIKTSSSEKRGAGDSPRPPDNQHSVTFAQLDPDDVFNIFEDDRDDDGSGEDEFLESGPCTVRERGDAALGLLAPRPDDSQTDQSNSKSSENVANMIQSSIYFAKIKETRMKIHSELVEIINYLDCINLACVDPYQIRKMGQRSAEFCGRFQRIHLYQLQRQLGDIKRHNLQALPFAKYTQFQSQMIRIVSLHQNLLQSLQVFHKSFEQTMCLCESSVQLQALCDVTRDVSAQCAECPVPQDCTAAKGLYNDDVLTAVEKLEESIKNYVVRSEEILVNAASTMFNKKQSLIKHPKKKKMLADPSVKSLKPKEQCNSLSMYSLDLLRKQSGKTISPKDKSKKKRKLKKKKEVPDAEKNHHKPQTLRRPLMRDPAREAGGGTQPPRRRATETDIHTLVETVGVDSQSAYTGSNEVTPRARNPAFGMPRHQYMPVLSSIQSETMGTETNRDESKSHKSELESEMGTISLPDSAPMVVITPKRGNNKQPPEPQLQPAPEVNKLIKQLCGEGNQLTSEYAAPKNTQLVCIKENNVQPSTPQLLKILEQTIQKKSPRETRKPKCSNPEKLRLTFNIEPTVADSIFQYRTKFVQHMLTSTMYANSAVGKPWETIGSIAERLIEEILMKCIKDMELQAKLQKVYIFETQQ